MQAIKKIEEHTAALARANALVEEAEALGSAFLEKGDRLASFLREFELVRDNMSEVQSLARHLIEDNAVHMASLHFQQEAAPLLTRMAAISQRISSGQQTSTPAAGDRLNAPAPTDKSTKKVSLSGWLRKKGKGAISNSHRRYFILDQSAPTQLRYYENDTLQKQKGYIPLDRMEAVLVNDSDATMFGVNTGDRLWSLQADTEHDARIWVKALSKWGESFQRLQLRQHILNREASEAAAAETSPRPTAQPSEPSPATANASMASEPGSSMEDLLKMQQEAEKREQIRQQESARRWKEKQELRFQREAARLKEEAATRYMTSSESQDLASHPPKQPLISVQRDVPSLNSSAASSPAASVKVDSPDSQPSSMRISTSEAEVHDSTALKEKLKAAMKLRRERTTALTDLLRQKQLFLTLKAEKMAEIAKIENADAEIVQLRSERDEAKLLATHLTTSITTYQQQLLEQDKLIGLMQGSVRQNEEKAAQLQQELDETRREFEILEPPFTTVSLSLASIAVQRMLVQSEMKTKAQVESKLEMLAEAYRAHDDLAALTKSAFREKEQSLQKHIQEHQMEMDELQEALDTTRHTFQYLRTLLNTDSGYSILEELDELKHDFFVTIVNGIKLNLIQEGHTLKLTSPTALFSAAKIEGVSQAEWPNWISKYIHSRCIETYPPDKRGFAAATSDADANEAQRVAVTSDPHLQQRAAYSSRIRGRKRNNNFGASLGGNFGGGGLMMM